MSGFTFQPKPSGDHYVCVHKSYKLITDGKHSTAALLSVLEYLAKQSLMQSKWQVGNPIPKDIAIDGDCNFPRLDRLLDGMLKSTAVRDKLQILAKLGFISIQIGQSQTRRFVTYHHAAIADALAKVNPTSPTPPKSVPLQKVEGKTDPSKKCTPPKSGGQNSATPPKSEGVPLQKVEPSNHLSNLKESNPHTQDACVRVREADTNNPKQQNIFDQEISASQQPNSQTSPANTSAVNQAETPTSQQPTPDQANLFAGGVGRDSKMPPIAPNSAPARCENRFRGVNWSDPRNVACWQFWAELVKENLTRLWVGPNRNDFAPELLRGVELHLKRCPSKVSSAKGACVCRISKAVRLGEWAELETWYDEGKADLDARVKQSEPNPQPQSRMPQGTPAQALAASADAIATLKRNLALRKSA